LGTSFEILLGVVLCTLPHGAAYVVRCNINVLSIDRVATSCSAKRAQLIGDFNETCHHLLYTHGNGSRLLLEVALG
jgi:hypothetical protein